MALTTTQRNTVRNAFIALFNNNSGAWSDGGRVTASQWADEQLAILDDYRNQTRPRAHYTLRHAPWIAARLGVNSTIRTAITNHCQGN